MKKKIWLTVLLTVALMAGCGQGELPQPQESAVSTEPVTSEVVETTLPTSGTEPTIQTTTDSTEATPETTTAPVTTTGMILPTFPQTENTICGHDYQASIYLAPTCDQAGYQNYRCSKCGDVQQQLSMPLGHAYEAATCTAAKVCSRCGDTDGASLGHQYTSGLCSRCGEKDPGQRTITIQVKDTKNAPVDGVTVALYVSDALHSTAVSTGGKVTFTLKNHTGSYTLVLTSVPAGYKPQKDSYTYKADSGSIVLELVPVIYPDDHSKAAYKVGSTMGDFTVTDIDGNSYQLSDLLREKKLVILNFWYYTCVPCKEEFPYFNSVYQKYSDDIEILGLNHFDNEGRIRQLRSEMELTFPLATENLGMQKGFGIQSYPVTVFIGSNGKILKIQKDVGFQSEAELETIIRQILGR